MDITLLRKSDALATRTAIQEYEDGLAALPNRCTMEDYKTTHEFADGLYRRTIYIPKDTYMTSCEHKYSHMATILDGIVEVVSETEHDTYVGPCQFITPAGTKRVLHTVTNVVWATVHSVPEGMTDIAELVDYLVVKRFHKE